MGVNLASSEGGILSNDMNFSLFEIDEGSPAKPAKSKSAGSVSSSTLQKEGILPATGDNHNFAGQHFDINVSQGSSYDSGLSLVDVKNEYPWALNDKSSREDVPAIFLIEYQITGGQIQNALNYWQKNLSGAATGIVNSMLGTANGSTADNNPYEGLYRATKTGFSYLLPYFGSGRRELNSEWAVGRGTEDAIAQTKGLITNNIEVGTSTIGWATNFLEWGKVAVESAVPSMGAEQVEIWESVGRQGVTVQFDLLNTISLEQTIKNYELISLLSYQNTYFRHNIMLSYPPVIYEYFIPGVRSCPVATMDVKIEDLGSKRKITSNNTAINNKIFPDAYRVTLTLKDKVAESRNVLKGFFDDDIVSAIDSTGITNQQIANNALNSAVNTFLGKTFLGNQKQHP